MTMWDAPGMQRIKIPAGGLNAEQLETLEALPPLLTFGEAATKGIGYVDRKNLEFTQKFLLDNGAMKKPVDLEGSGFSQKRTRNVVQIANELPRFREGLAEARDDRQRFTILKSASPESLSVLAATAPGEQANIARFAEYEKFQLQIRGNDLEVPPGPHVAQALERTREAVFMGEIAPTEARSFARRVAMEYFQKDEA